MEFTFVMDFSISVLDSMPLQTPNILKKPLFWVQLTTVKVVLRKAERRSFYPPISSLGVKIDVNIVNITKPPPYFHSRHEIYSKMRAKNTCFVNNKKTLRRGLGSQC